MKKIAFCLMGPTAIGKTDLACALTVHLPLEIINVDSSLMYQELNIGAAKPEASILQAFPHHLVNCCSLKDIYSVAEFKQDVMALMQEIFNKGRIPLLVGGTMMYFHALQQGLAALPQASQELRQSFLLQAEQKGWQAMHAQLAQVDPIAAQKIHPNDQQRILRGLEIYQLTGKPWTTLIEQEHSSSDIQWYNLALMPEPRKWLHQRIEQRLSLMVEQGFIQEVEHILSLPDLNLEHPALRSVGYRQAIAFLKGQLQAHEWQEKALFATRQLAKRQMTWIRGFDNKIVFLCPDDKIQSKIVALMQEILDNDEKFK